MNQHAPRDEYASLTVRPYKIPADVVPGIAFLVDLTAMAVAALTGRLVAHLTPMMETNHAALVVAAVGCLYFAQAKVYGFYRINALMALGRALEQVFIGVGVAMMLLYSVHFALETEGFVPRSWSLVFALALICFMSLGRILLRAGLVMLARRGVIGHNLAVLGTGDQARRFIDDFRRSNSEFVRVVGAFALSAGAGGPRGDITARGDVADLLAAARQGQIDDVVIAVPWNADPALAHVIETLKELPINVYLSWCFTGYDMSLRPVVSHASNQSLLEVVKRPISGWASLLKRVQDYTLASLLVVLVSPILLVVAIAIRIDSPGPILFRQARLGFNNKVFQIYKFRSMRHSDEKEVVVRQAARNDSRVTRVGRFIRATSLDELPQLFNVLGGTMSLVGPRPHAISHNEEYGSQIRGYFARHRVKPGITGWAQVNGLRGETETLNQMEARIRYDVYYANNWSLLFDMKILVMTAVVVFFQKTAY